MIDGCVIDMEKARREELRWLILYALHSGQTVGAAESMLRQAVMPLIPDVTDSELRKALDYLADRGLATVERRQVWYAKINHHGIDVVEYAVDCHPGIARPAKW